MSEYQLIAFDLDGTLLNTQKQITQPTIDAVNRAIDAGKYVCFSTGRSYPEVSELLEILPGIRYVILVSGAIVYDLQEKKVIYSEAIPEVTVRKMLEVGRDYDCMIHFLGFDSVTEPDKIEKMELYGMAPHKPMFRRVMHKVESIHDYFKENPQPVAKFNFYHRTQEGRIECQDRLRPLGIEMKFAEISSLECSAPGVNKGIGLKALCEHLGIDISESIAVGDADNDLDILKTAGLAIGMGNANDNVRAISDVIVADCDHDGCVEAIEKYLL